MTASEEQRLLSIIEEQSQQLKFMSQLILDGAKANLQLTHTVMEITDKLLNLEEKVNKYPLFNTN